MNKYASKKSNWSKPVENNTTVPTLKNGIDYECIVIDYKTSIKDALQTNEKLISQVFTFKDNSSATFYINPDKNEIFIDKVDYLNQDAHLLIKLLNVDNDFTIKSISILNSSFVIFATLSKKNDDRIRKAIKLNDIIQIRDGNRICYG